MPFALRYVDYVFIFVFSFGVQFAAVGPALRPKMSMQSKPSCWALTVVVYSTMHSHNGRRPPTTKARDNKNKEAKDTYFLL